MENPGEEPPADWIDGKLPPPLYGSFVGGNKPPGGGFAKFQHLDRRYDGKSLRKAVQRRVIDYHSSCIRYLQERSLRRQVNRRDYPWIQPEKNFLIDYLPTFARKDRVVESVPTKFIHSSVNKIKNPINVVRWTPDGRRLLTGTTSGEFTLWNGTMFNFETIMQAHDAAVRSMVWSHSERWMISSDHTGIVKYWQPNLNNVKIIQAHREPVRCLSFSPTDIKFASCSDDSTIKIWDFNEAREELMLTGHGWDVKCVDWHPNKGLLASGSKDNLIKLWDPKSGKNLSTFHGHKNTILGLQWNKNGNWLAAGSRDQLVKVYDIRMMRELQSFKGHKKEINSLTWHPHHEEMFATGGSDGSVYFWMVGDVNPVGTLESAHDSNVWSLDWHPMGHIFSTGSNDHATRFWTRHRPEDDLTADMYINGKPEDQRIGGPYMQQHQQRNYHNQQSQQPPASLSTSPLSFSNQTAIPGLEHVPTHLPQQGGIPGLNGEPPRRDRRDNNQYGDRQQQHNNDHRGRGDGRDHQRRNNQQPYRDDRNRRNDRY